MTMAPAASPLCSAEYTTTSRMPPAIPRHNLGTELRRLRQAKSLRLEDVASRLGLAPSTLSRIEAGKAPTRSSYLNLMLDIYGVDSPGQREHLADLAREGRHKNWWTGHNDLLAAGTGDYLGLEIAASLVRSYSGRVVSDVLQVPGYAAA